ncbi:caspase-3-like [Dendronephthya gigantea]|uniref:caspase-3-like n=1 Tax=Dendronephthya gigantea TaxID=151771 RepID=UPI00106D0F19|nr:caspase-3-like [Dendronephthya gigantea]
MKTRSEAKKEKTKLIAEPEIRKVFALSLINENFTEKRLGADADRKNINQFCRKANFSVNKLSDLKLCNTENLKTDNLTGEEIGDLFKTILTEGDFSSYDAFVCFISSHGNPDGIVGVDGNTHSFEKIFKRLSRCNSLVGKPKLLFAQNCRGEKRDYGVTRPMLRTQSDHVHSNSLTIPKEADILVAYSSVDGYESYRDTKEGSWFITALTQVFNAHFKELQVTDMLAIVNEAVASREHAQGWKQMPCFSSTLRRSVIFKTVDPIRKTKKRKLV